MRKGLDIGCVLLTLSSPEEIWHLMRPASDLRVEGGGLYRSPHYWVMPVRSTGETTSTLKAGSSAGPVQTWHGFVLVRVLFVYTAITSVSHFTLNMKYTRYRSIPPPPLILSNTNEQLKFRAYQYNNTKGGDFRCIRTFYRLTEINFLVVGMIGF